MVELTRVIAYSKAFDLGSWIFRKSDTLLKTISCRVEEFWRYVDEGNEGFAVGAMSGVPRILA